MEHSVGRSRKGNICITLGQYCSLSLLVFMCLTWATSIHLQEATTCFEG